MKVREEIELTEAAHRNLCHKQVIEEHFERGRKRRK